MSWTNVIQNRDLKLNKWKEQRNRFYKCNPILFEMLKTLKARETAFLGDSTQGASPVRCVKAHQVGYLERNFKSYNFYNRPYNVYISLASLQGIPMFSFAPVIRRKQQKEFNVDFKKYVYDYDLAFDFEGKASRKFGREKEMNFYISILEDENISYELIDEKRGYEVICDHKDIFNLCWRQVKLLKSSFDDYNIPYVLKFSGGGFHIRIMGKYLPKGTSWEERVSFCKDFASKIQPIFALSTLDMSIYDLRRVFKAPYSIDIKSGLVALPLSNFEFESNNMPEDYDYLCDPERIIDIKEKIKFRGLLERKGNKDNFNKYYEEVIK